MKKSVDLVVIGGGPAGLAAAAAARNSGLKEVVLIERHPFLGGILPQCIHHGFGLQRYKEELTGPEYAERTIQEAQSAGVEILTGTMVLEITPEKTVYAMGPQGVWEVQARAIILAMGCRERTRGAIRLAGTRPAGVYTAGTVQALVNLEGYLPGREAVILGSGDIGLIMARRLTLEGVRVKAVIELQPYPGGLLRNVVQCLEDYQIPLLLSHTATRVLGRDRVEGVEIAQVNSKGEVLAETSQTLSCDTLILSVGLIPENELARGIQLEMDPVTGGPRVNTDLQTSMEGVFACGNCLHVHDLVDYVSEEGQKAGESAARYLSQRPLAQKGVAVRAGQGLRYVLPQALVPISRTTLYTRAQEPRGNSLLVLRTESGEVVHKQKEAVVRPGEMMRMKLPPRPFDQPLVLSLEGGESK